MATHASTKPRALKKPQDHKQPKDEPQTVTVNGVSINVDGSKLDDLDFLESLYDMSSDPEKNVLEIVPFLRGLFGDQYGQFKDAIRDKDTGTATVSKMAEVLPDVLGQLNPNS
ncbi:hypothetical protein J3U01_08625 [Bifidobacterium sp. B4107]|uniref:hypothetical protein n=1 Tax=unclassified Bifidobacterium TaxID=2608897 RepID=UPI00226BB3DD|nr:MULTISPECIES: hypothetical protein [unclassified Bifidobacterium]MCX8648463.1 hypothetical protein [Bifidobacterium sp. B4107]MCX8652545.1 hypothetical protein [Bifidobacterium sp. B4111]MCX8659091.1 hypothetical protein [Bifidobacterium sp. B4114]